MQSLADIAGAGATVPLNAPNITARFLILAVVGNGTVRIGGASAGAAQGVALTSANGPVVFPVVPGHESTSPYGLQGIFAYIPNGTTLSIAYEPFTG
jgi:hypothetical protein